MSGRQSMHDHNLCVAVATVEGLYGKAIEALAKQREKHDLYAINNPSAVTNIYPLQTFEEVYNPITDDALCFKLMVKHGIRFEPTPPAEIANGWGAYKTFRTVTGASSEHDDNPNRAICKAIVRSGHDFSGLTEL